MMIPLVCDKRDVGKSTSYPISKILWLTTFPRIAVGMGSVGQFRALGGSLALPFASMCSTTTSHRH
jgi:hypothetical protein